MGIPKNFNWMEYFVLHPEIIHNKRGSFSYEYALFHWIQVGRKQKIQHALHSEHPFNKLNKFNYVLKNNKLTFDDTYMTKSEMFKTYVVDGIRDDIIKYNVILSDDREFIPINDLINVQISHDLKIKISSPSDKDNIREYQITEDLFMKLIDDIKPDLFVIQNIDRWKSEFIDKFLDKDIRYMMFFCDHYDITKYNKYFDKAYVIVTDSNRIKGFNVIHNSFLGNIQMTEYDKSKIEEDKKNFKFNIVGTSKYFSEYVDLLKNYDFSNDSKIEDEKTINIKLHFPFKEGGYVINTEKNISDNWKETIETFKKDNVFIDFCRANSQITGNNTLFLPCVFHKNVIWSHPRTFEYDIGFIGTISIKRKKLLDELVERGLKVNIIKSFGEERDREISKCKIIINIHFNDNHKILQYFRCSRIVFNKIPIISENIFECDELDINKEVLKFITFEEYDKLVNKVINILENYDSYVEKLYKDFSYDRFEELSSKAIQNFKYSVL